MNTDISKTDGRKNILILDPSRFFGIIGILYSLEKILMSAVPTNNLPNKIRNICNIDQAGLYTKLPAAYRI